MKKEPKVASKTLEKSTSDEIKAVDDATNQSYLLGWCEGYDERDQENNDSMNNLMDKISLYKTSYELLVSMSMHRSVLLNKENERLRKVAYLSFATCLIIGFAIGYLVCKFI